ncbi:hypothetical protein ACFFRR_010770 [Megaselia abdita]
MKCNLCVENKASSSPPSDCFIGLLEKIKLHYNAFQKKNTANEMRLQTLEDLNSDYKRQLDILAKRNDSLHMKLETMKNTKKRKKTTSMDIEDDENILTDDDLNVAVHSRNIFDDSSLQVLSPRNDSVDNIFYRKKTPIKNDDPNNIFNQKKTPSKVDQSPEPWNIFNKTPKKTSPVTFKTPSKSSESKTKRILALYSPKSKTILASPAKSSIDLPKRVPLKSDWTSKRPSSSSNLKNSMSFITNVNCNKNKENKALIQSRLVFPRNEGNSLILDSEEETFCEEIQSSQKSPGPRHNKSKRLKKATNSIVKCLAANFFNPVSRSKNVATKEATMTEIPVPASVTIKQEPVEEEDDDDARSVDLLAELINSNESRDKSCEGEKEADKDSDLEVVDEAESLNIETMDLIAEMNKQGTENLHYIKSIDEANALKIQKRNEAKARRLSLKNNNPEPSVSTSTPKPEAKKIAPPLENPALVKIKEEPRDESMDNSDAMWEEFEQNEFDEVANKKNNPVTSDKEYPEMPTVLQKIIIPKKRTYKDCIDCMQFIKDYGHELSKEAIDKRIEKCKRHNRNEDDLDTTPEGFWDPFMRSLPADDRRKEILYDYRLVNQKK